MIKFLFWNIGKKPLAASVGKLVREHDIDVVALVECKVSTDDMLAALNDAEGNAFSPGMTELDDVAVFTRLGARSFRTRREDPAARLSIRQLMLPSGMDILLAVTHLPSKLHWSERKRGRSSFRASQHMPESGDATMASHLSGRNLSSCVAKQRAASPFFF